MGLLSTKTTLLGEGVSGTVYLLEKDKKQYAVKTCRNKESYESRKEYRDRVLHEYHILEQLKHENFIAVFKYKVLMDGLTVKMYMEAGTLDLARLCKQVGPSLVSKSEIFCLWKQLCNGVRYLHSEGLCHRDLKLENLVMDRHSSTLKIVDLATACKSGNGIMAVGIVGSRLYMAPETFAQIEYDGQRADIWSVAIILYYLVNRSFPWGSAVWNDQRYVDYARHVSAMGNTSGSISPNTISSGPTISSSSGPTTSTSSGPTSSGPTTPSSSGCNSPLNTSQSGMASHPELASNPVFCKLPIESVPLGIHLLAPDPKLRYDMERIIHDCWLCQIPCCGGGSTCGSLHALR